MPTLYIVSTPIGNLEDISLRALRVLKEVPLIAAEDTRHTRKLLQRYEITTPLVSYHEHSAETRLEQLLAALDTGDLALVSDAGTPGISDPGYDLVNACIARGITVTAIPGPSAPVAALVASGLPSDRYCFIGFLPRKKAERRALLSEFASFPATLVAFEAPHRLEAALADMLAVLGDRRIVVARELTKLHEQLLRAPISQALEYFKQQRPRGEITLVIEGVTRTPTPAEAEGDAAAMADSAAADSPPIEERIVERLRELRAAGLKGSAAARQVARELGVGKSLAYDLWVRLDSG